MTMLSALLPPLADAVEPTVMPALLAGAIAVWLLLPRPKPFPRLVGAAAAAAALLFAGAFLVHVGAASIEGVLFYAFSGIAILAGGLMITQHNPAYAALSFTLVVLSSCGLFLLQAAPFLMASTVIIYAGAIIVTFLFVLMLAQWRGPSDADDRSREPLLATVSGFILMGALVVVVQLTYEAPVLDTILERFIPDARAAAKKETAEEMAAALKREDYFTALANELSEYEKTLEDNQRPVPRSLVDYRVAIDDEISSEWIRARAARPPDVNLMRHALERLDEETNRLRALRGSHLPGVDVTLSPSSGPPPNKPPLPAEELQWDERGDAVLKNPMAGTRRSAMPAENVAHVGRSLFTDFLLSVELGGVILLVATIGAIAIAQRGGERT